MTLLEGIFIVGCTIVTIENINISATVFKIINKHTDQQK